jgi:hypothetical protein
MRIVHLFWRSEIRHRSGHNPPLAVTGSDGPGWLDSGVQRVTQASRGNNL